MEKQEKIDLIKKFESKNEGRFFFEERDNFLKIYALGTVDLNIPKGYIIRKYNDKYNPNKVELYYGDTFLASGYDIAEKIEKSKVPKKRVIKYRAKQAGIIPLMLAGISIPLIMGAYPLYSAIKTRYNPFKLDDTGYHTTMETQIDENNNETVTYSDDFYEKASDDPNNKYLFKNLIFTPNKRSIIEKYCKPLINTEGKKVRVVEIYDVTDVNSDEIKSYLSKDKKIETSKLFGSPIKQKVVECSADDLDNKEYYKATIYSADKVVYQTVSENIGDIEVVTLLTFAGAFVGFLLSSIPFCAAFTLGKDDYIDTKFEIKDLGYLKKKLKKLKKQQKLSLTLKENKNEVL